MSAGFSWRAAIAECGHQPPTSVDAQELVNTVAPAMRHDIKATELRDAVYTHPSSTEAFNEVLGTIVREDF